MPASFANLPNGNWPINIIRKQTPNSINAVEKFSGRIKTQVSPTPISIYLKIWFSVNFPRLLSKKATNTTQASFPNSEGWNCIPMISSHRCASLASTPIKGVTININIETGNNIINAEKKRHGILCNSNTMTKPPNKKVACRTIGAQWFAFL